MSFVHFYMVPFTGLGRFNGYRGDEWLKSRIKIFQEYVAPSLIAQDPILFHLWFCFRPEEKNNPIVKDFQKTLEYTRGLTYRSVFTFGGIPFWDDKYDDETAAARLKRTLEVSLPELKSWVGENTHVLITIQPSDDMYLSDTAKRLQSRFMELLEKEPGVSRRAVGLKKGYIMCYNTGEIAEYTTREWTTDDISTYHTDTIPPFFTILFPVDVFLDPVKHYNHIGPYRSHEYIVDVMPYEVLEGRGFVVGTHGENISTTFSHRYRGRAIIGKEKEELLLKVGRMNAEVIIIKPNLRMRLRKVVNKLPWHNKIKELYYRFPLWLRPL